MRNEIQATPKLVVGSGKGGTGKSTFATMAAASLANQDRRVLLVDGDQNLGNLHLLLRIVPDRRLEAMFAGDVDPCDLVMPVAANLWLLPGDTGSEALSGVGSLDRARLHHRLSSLFDSYDVVIVDAAAGIEGVVRACTISSTGLVMLTEPEPAALSDAFSVIKIVNLQVPNLPIDIVVNKVANDAEGLTAFDTLQSACSKFLRKDLGLLGSIPNDLLIRSTIRGGESLVAGAADGAAAAAIRSMITTWHDQRAEQQDAAMTAARS